jgi:hypothetical protein
MFKRAILFATLLIGIVIAHSQFAGALTSRNPFGVLDVAAPDGPDVLQLAARIQMPGDASDRNAPQWSESITPGNPDKLDGEGTAAGKPARPAPPRSKSSVIACTRSTPIAADGWPARRGCWKR